MPGKRISELTALTGANSASNDDVVVFDTSEGVTKRITRAQLAIGMQADNQTLNIADGVTAPTAVIGRALIYVDSADGDLKIRFGDGTIKTIVTDT